MCVEKVLARHSSERWKRSSTAKLVIHFDVRYLLSKIKMDPSFRWDDGNEGLE